MRSVSTVAGLVRTAAMISTTFISGTGLKKCRPAKRPGCLHFAAICATTSEDVLLASIACSDTMASSEANSACFAPMSSMIASITTSQVAGSSNAVQGLMPAMSASAYSRV